MMRLTLTLFMACLSWAAQAQLTMEDASVRAMPPGQPNTAAFFTLKNESDQAIRLVQAKSSVSKKAEYHLHKKNAQGVMSMVKQDAITIEAGEQFEFKSGAYHVMLMGLSKNLIPGEMVQLTLQDQNGKQYQFSLPVVSLLKQHDHHHHH